MQSVGKPIVYRSDSERRQIQFYRDGSNPKSIEARVTAVVGGMQRFTVSGDNCHLGFEAFTKVSEMTVMVQNQFLNADKSVQERGVPPLSIILAFEYSH